MHFETGSFPMAIETGVGKNKHLDRKGQIVCSDDGIQGTWVELLLMLKVGNLEN